MSGIFLKVEEILGEGHVEPRVLRDSIGRDPPHVTLYYGGLALPLTEPSGIEFAYMSYKLWGMLVGLEFVCDTVTVNSFTVEKTGKQRHDVLLHPAAGDGGLAAAIQQADATYGDGGDRYRMPTIGLHITLGHYSTRQEADDQLLQIGLGLPIRARVVGIYID